LLLLRSHHHASVSSGRNGRVASASREPSNNAHSARPIRALIAAGADPHAVDAEEKTPLSRAAARNLSGIVDLINDPR